ncbi:MAG: type II toxin-antitoxin system RelE/ParE family toxin [Nisaea sp.]|uniref:type II toxin-antitoxin system RelE/ParE family toxin n=1 Tax=Nisaea sp. TaxID=2024842 RepID=UPI001B1FDD4A|nr:type II toxin-antitoxin system RelE/ParE family toxin [Nisaea sp.]MBO6561105.1 type II toxin-antitoxin system RelE/ParE family toxin [Nisaea sp.]
MPPGESGAPTHYRLTPRARADLEEIWLYSEETWSAEKADDYIDALTEGFEALLRVPEMARERTELRPPVRIHPLGGHLIVYRILEDHIEIVRLLGGRQNWVAILAALDEGQE